MLDASLPPPYFFERNEDGSLKVTIEGWGADEEIFAFMPLDDDSEDEEDEYYDDDGEDGKLTISWHRAKDTTRRTFFNVFKQFFQNNFTNSLWMVLMNYKPSSALLFWSIWGGGKYIIT